VKLKECKGVFKLWWNAGDDETKEFALDSQPVELYNYYVNTNNVVNVYVEVLNGGGNEVATVGNEKMHKVRTNMLLNPMKVIVSMKKVMVVLNWRKKGMFFRIVRKREQLVLMMGLGVMMSYW